MGSIFLNTVVDASQQSNALGPDFQKIGKA
jgi:hypothetical protein